MSKRDYPSRPRVLRSPARVAIEVKISDGRTFLRVSARGTEQLYAEGIGELTVDLGNGEVLVITPDGQMETRDVVR